MLEMGITKSNDKAVSTKLYHYYLKYPQRHDHGQNRLTYFPLHKMLWVIRCTLKLAQYFCGY